MPPPQVQENLYPTFPMRWLVRYYPLSAELHNTKAGATRQAGASVARAYFVIPTHAVKSFVRERLHVLEHGGIVPLGPWVGDLDEPLGQAHDMAVFHREAIKPGELGVSFPWQLDLPTDADRDALRQAYKDLCVDLA